MLLGTDPISCVRVMTCSLLVSWWG